MKRVLTQTLLVRAEAEGDELLSPLVLKGVAALSVGDQIAGRRMVVEGNEPGSRATVTLTSHAQEIDDEFDPVQAASNDPHGALVQLAHMVGLLTESVLDGSLAIKRVLVTLEFVDETISQPIVCGEATDDDDVAEILLTSLDVTEADERDALGQPIKAIERSPH